MPSGIYKRTKEHGEAISAGLKKIGHRPPIFFGEKSSNWKGGIIIRSGYRYIHLPEHPFSGKQGYIAEHRIVMEKMIGRYLNRGEVVHHKNHNILDNRPENLVLYKSAGEHTKIEHRDIFEKQGILNKGKHFSRRTEFKKGNIPWNRK